MFSRARHRRHHAVGLQVFSGRGRAACAEALESRLLLSAGDPDPTFGQDGVASLAGTATMPAVGGNALVLQNNGSMIVGGDGFLLARFDKTGVLDPTFRNALKVFPADAFGSIKALALLPDGRFVAAGQADEGIALARFLPNGTLDRTFGNQGTVITEQPGQVLQANALAIDSAGRIVVAAINGDMYSIPTPIVARYTANGTLDQTFGHGGFAPTFAANTSAERIVIQKDGSIDVAGTRSTIDSNGFTTSDAVVAQFKSNGSLNQRFGTAGIGLIPGTLYNPIASIAGIGIQPGGGIVVAAQVGDTEAGVTYEWPLLARLRTNGQLDTSFGGDSQISVDIATPTAFVMLKDGSSLLVGNPNNHDYEISVAKYLPNGQPDPNFGPQGLPTFGLGDGPYNAASAMVVQPNGDMLVAGDSNGAPAITRLDPSGNVDRTFGHYGSAVPSAGGFQGSATAIVVQRDGKIVVGGTGDWNVERFLPDGTLDPSFGRSGLARVMGAQEFTGQTQVNALLLEPDGKIVAAGQFDDLPAIARFNPDGSLDTRFGSGGMVVTDLHVRGSGGAFVSLALQSDGRIVAGGSITVFDSSFNPVAEDPLSLARFTSTGALDPTFGHNGVVATAFSGKDPALTHIALEPNGGIVAAGTATLARYTRSGALDTTFGAYGSVKTPFASSDPSSPAQIDDMRIDPTGRVLLAGTTPDERGTLVRYKLSGQLDQAFGAAGVAHIPTFAPSDPTSDFFAYSQINAITLTSGGNIIVTGGSFYDSAGFDPYAAAPPTGADLSGQPPIRPFLGGGRYFLVAIGRFTPNGALDRRFGANGIVTLGGIGIGYPIALQPDGKLLTAAPGGITRLLLN